MSSESSLVTTAASSDTSSSADSRYWGGRARDCVQYPSYDGTRKAAAPSIPPQWYHYYYASPAAIPVQSPVANSRSPGRRRTYNLKARGVVIAKSAGCAASPGSGPNQKVFCVCKSCKGQRMVSKSTCYRHLRVEADQIDEYHVKWDHVRWGSSGRENVTPLSRGQEADSRMHVAVGHHHLPSIPTGFHSRHLVQ